LKKDEGDVAEKQVSAASFLQSLISKTGMIVFYWFTAFPFYKG
jgi:hypothetical protein